jgi:ABC-2 type transport system ATP-binding protein
LTSPLPGLGLRLLGPNGAGKTTTIRMLATLLRPDEGTARVFGHDVVEEANAVRSRVSLTGQFASVEEDLTGRETLVLLGRLLGHSRRDAKRRAADLLDAFGLAEAAGRLVKSYSGGMRRRLDVAASIIVRPDRLFLDEPTTGLDPLSRKQVRELVRASVAHGTTVLLTTQYLDEADQLADRIAVIDHGTVIAEGTSAELKASTGRGALHVRVQGPQHRPQAQRLLTHALQVPVRRETDPSALSATVPDPSASPRRLPSFPGRASRSPSSPSANRPSTRSSSPSPAAQAQVTQSRRPATPRASGGTPRARRRRQAMRSYACANPRCAELCGQALGEGG